MIPLSDGVIRSVAEHFPPTDRNEMHAILGAIAEKDPIRRERIGLAIISLSGGDLVLAREYAERALLDAEMVVARAERGKV